MIPLLLLAAVVTFRPGPQTTILIEIGAGDVRIIGTPRADVVVDGTGVTAESIGSRIVVRSPDAGAFPDRKARARVELQVPSAIAIEAIRIVDGELSLEGLTGSVSADVRQGRIKALNVTGVLRLETGFGDVVVDRARLMPEGLLRLRAFNGDVRLTLVDPPENARILALTFNGRIESNLPLVRKEAFGPKFAEGTFGSGEPVVSIDSVTGTIVIRAPAAARLP